MNQTTLKARTTHTVFEVFDPNDELHCNLVQKAEGQPLGLAYDIGPLAAKGVLLVHCNHTVEAVPFRVLLFRNSYQILIRDTRTTFNSDYFEG